MFNSNIPYGLAPKAELLTALNVKGKWNTWMYFYGLDIKPRTFNNKNYKILSYVIRLSPFNYNNDIKNNWILRWIGIYLLVKQILDTQKDHPKLSSHRNKNVKEQGQEKIL